MFDFSFYFFIFLFAILLYAYCHIIIIIFSVETKSVNMVSLSTRRTEIRKNVCIINYTKNIQFLDNVTFPLHPPNDVTITELQQLQVVVPFMLYQDVAVLRRDAAISAPLTNTT